MYYLLEWLNGLLVVENINAIVKSLKRRIFRFNFLEMRADLNAEEISSQIWDDMDIRGYSECFEKNCISLLNSVGSLGLWNRARFQNDILSSVEDTKNDIFVVCRADFTIGIAVIHKKSLSNNLNEIGYVAVRPEYRGERIGYKLLMYVLTEMKRRNINQTYLRTDSFRIPAIKTYLKCGFYPYIKNENEKKRWQNVMNKIKNI